MVGRYHMIAEERRRCERSWWRRFWDIVRIDCACGESQQRQPARTSHEADAHCRILDGEVRDRLLAACDARPARRRAPAHARIFLNILILSRDLRRRVASVRNEKAFVHVPVIVLDVFGC